jgi:DGQHR domain-containing protein
MFELDDQSPEIIQYKAITGNFGKVRYFITTLDHSDAVENIRFADELQQSWTFSERVQRKLDEKRAKTEIFTYLAKDGIRFFNAIVVVLLPNSNNQREFWDFSQVSSQGRPVEKWVNLELYKGVSRIVIDGQHRLLALKKYWDVHTGKEFLTPAEKSDDFDCTQGFDIPVVYLVFGNLGRVGFSEETEFVRDEIIKATRNIFTVINKTAKPIDKQTQLLLDDSKVSALIPRKLLEDAILSDKFVKWSSKSRSLTSSDPYLTTLDLVSQCSSELLKDYKKQVLNRSLNSPKDRDSALEMYYLSHPKIPEIGTREIFRWFFCDLQPFQDWIQQLNHVGVDIPLQPEHPHLTATQKKQIREMRESSIAYTIIGQRIIFSAASRFLLRVRSEYRIPETLSFLANSIAMMQASGFLNRNASHWQDVIVQPNEKLSMITKGSGSERCIDLMKMIFLNSSEGVRELIRKVREEINPQIDWTESRISQWRNDFHVILPEVDLIEDEIQQASESSTGILDELNDELGYTVPYEDDDELLPEEDDNGSSEDD